MMSPFYRKPMGGTMRHKLTIFVLTDSLASVADEWSHTMGKKTRSGRASSLLVRKDGKWLVKAMMEGGWGDAMKEGAAQAGAPAAPAEAATPK